MRYMIIVKASAQSEAGQMPTEAHIASMGKYNEELQKAGVLLDLSGLKPTSAAARVMFSGGQRTVVDGPFTESKDCRRRHGLHGWRRASARRADRR
jgi:hypothetical protein